MSRLTLVWVAPAWAGATLALGSLRWFRRPGLVERLRPYAPHGPAGHGAAGRESTVRAAVAPVAGEVGALLARALGVREDLSTSLARVHSEGDASEFRTRQLGWAVGAGAVGLALALVTPAPTPVGLVLMFGGPLLAFLLLEGRLSCASAKWQRRILLELPVISEQLGMLLGAGYSLGATLHRLATRTDGACATDLRRVNGRIRQGVDEVTALREWADLAAVPALTRLTDVLALNHQATDLGPLIADEARATRREVQRELLQTVERRAQLVWIPVTVATLVPGVMFLAVPFAEAMRLFAGT